MNIRTASAADLDAITEVERICFPAAEAAGKQSFEGRLRHFANHFWVVEDSGKIVAFVNGMVTDAEHLTDEMYADASMHDENGRWQMIFGVDTIPEYRRRGCAEQLLSHAISQARQQGRAGLVLTCKDRLVHYYAKFGFVDEGISDSEHGGAVWHEMRIKF